MLLNSLYAPFAVGGAEAVTEMLAECLAARGHLVTVVTSCSRTEGASVEERNGVSVRRFFPENLWWLYERFQSGDARSALAKLRWRLNDAWNVQAGKQFGTLLDEVAPDILHTHNVKGFSPTVWHQAHARGIPVVHTAHSYELICTTGSLLDGRSRSCLPAGRCWTCKAQGTWYKRHAGLVDLFCSPSRFLLDAHRQAGISGKSVAHVRNGLADKAPAAGKTRDPRRLLRFIYIGQLAVHKGIEVLIDALTAVPTLPLSLDIAGDGILRSRIEALAAADRRVRYHGFVRGAQKQALLSDADVLIFPSIWVENSPLVIAEALCASIPVIGSRIGAIPELVEDDANGLLFPAGNAQALAECMASLVHDRRLLERLSQGSLAIADGFPGADEMTSRYLTLYRSLLGTGSRAFAPSPAAPASDAISGAPS